MVIKHPQLKRCCILQNVKKLLNYSILQNFPPHNLIQHYYKIVFCNLNYCNKGIIIKVWQKCTSIFHFPLCFLLLRTPLLPRNSLGDQGSFENVAQKGKIKENLPWCTGQEAQWVPFISNHWTISWSSQETQIKGISEHPQISSGDLLAPAVPTTLMPVWGLILV